MVGWRHRLNGHEFKQTLGDSEGPESLHAVVHGVAKIGHDLATEQQQLDKVFPENYVLRDSHNWEIPSLRSLWCPCNVPVQLPPGHSSSEELTTLWNRLFRLENLPEVLSGTQCLLASSL